MKPTTEKQKHKRNFLLVSFLTPMLILAVGLMWLSLRVESAWSSLLVNLVASIFGSILTVFYVDHVVQRNEKLHWATVMGHVGKQVNTLANATFSSIRSALGLTVPIEWMNDVAIAYDPCRMRSVMSRFIEERLIPETPRLSEISPEAWQSLARNLRAIVMNAERIMSLFGRNLDPAVMEWILDIQETARGILGQFEICNDMLGVPLNELPQNRRGESMEPYMRAVYKIIVRETTQLLKLSVRVLRELENHFPDRPTVSLEN
jgi:hypothetical protein